MTDVKVIAGPSSWIEGAAVQQLHKMAELPGMVRAVGMPDLHPGQGCPVGAVFVTEHRIYPHLVGSDIGCGMGLWTTTIQKPRPERLEKKLKGLESAIDTAAESLQNACVEPCGFEHSLGTIGRGNHFAEIVVLDEIRNPERVNAIIPDNQENALLLVHSGSRGYGEKILFEHTAIHRDNGLSFRGTEHDPFGGNEQAAFEHYMQQHDHALEWAKLNRQVIAERMLQCLGGQGERVFDIPHNFVEAKLGEFANDLIFFVHRKGAIPSDRGPVVIPGSRGSHSYLVEPTASLITRIQSGWSLSHGAGRKMSRRDALVKNKNESTKNLTQTKLGSRVICEDNQLLAEEAPNTYKNITQVIDDLVSHRLIDVLATLKPILTYKMRRL